MTKSPRNSNKTKYLTSLTTGREASRAISARVPEELAAEFDLARAVANKHGKELSITMIIRHAMQEAINEVTAVWPNEMSGQGEMFSEKASDDASKVASKATTDKASKVASASDSKDNSAAA